MKVSDFDFHLPIELLAEYPTSRRDASKLMVIDRQKGSIEHHKFSDIPTFFTSKDLLVRNSTKVKPVRFLARKEHLEGAKLEVLLIDNIDNLRFQAFVDPLVKLKVGSRLLFGDGKLTAILEEIIEQRSVILRFEQDSDSVEGLLKAFGQMPLPRYIKRKPEENDFNRYQTVYAEKESSLAAPTSGLHFTEDLFNQLKKKGVKITDLNLEIGLGTFNPVYVDEIKDHQMHHEKFQISDKSASLINEWKSKENRVIALGTTSIRATESAYANDVLHSGKFETNIFINPPYTFKVADALITNFHTPRSTLLMLVCAFGGYDLIMRAYREAIENKYRFYSYGDSMMIL